MSGHRSGRWSFTIGLDSKFAEVAMMMHINAARDEMIELGNEIIALRNKTTINTPNLDRLIKYIKNGDSN